MSSLECVAASKNGAKVYVDRDHTNVMLHIAETPNLLELVKEALEQSDVVGEKVALAKDMGRVVGTTSLVETDDSDEIVYAKRHERDSYTRFAKNRELGATSLVTVILFRADENDGTYRLWSAWCGRLVPSAKEPGGYEFWKTHALAYDPAIIDESTVTAVQPAKYMEA